MTDPGGFRPSPQRLLVWCLVAIVVMRLASLCQPALVDTTEGRYGATALHMLQTGDWLLPQIPLDHGWEPYLGKPPLHFWLMAASFAVFGADEWAARLPSLLAAVLMTWAAMSYARWKHDRETAHLAGIVLGSAVLPLVFAGSVNVDTTLAAFVTLAIVAFCRVGAGGPGSRLQGYVFFASLGLAVLTKGPFAIALTGLVGIAHLVVHRDWRIATRLPWIGGGALFAAIVVPWYWLAEARNPGFLHYFLVQENLGRWTSNEYGDRYGAGRRHALGSVWPQWLGCTMPWSLPLLLALGARRWRTAAWAGRRGDGAFLLLWAIAPAVAFTLSPQFTVGYLLPGFGGFAVLAARALRAFGDGGSPLGAPLLRGLARGFAWLVVVAAVLVWIGFGAGPWRGALCTGAGIGFCVWQHRRLKCDGREVPGAAAWLGVAVTWAIGLATFVSAPYVSATRSAAPMLARVLAEAPGREHRIGILFGTPYSAWFYGDAWAPDRVRFEHVHQHDLAAAGIVELFVRTGDFDGMEAATKERFRIAATIGEWIWMVRRD